MFPAEGGAGAGVGVVTDARHFESEIVGKLVVELVGYCERVGDRQRRAETNKMVRWLSGGLMKTWECLMLVMEVSAWCLPDVQVHYLLHPHLFILDAWAQGPCR